LQQEHIMGGHHLILGKLIDVISGETLDDTLDERHRQKIARLLVTRKGYRKSDITPRHELQIDVDGRCAKLWISYTVNWGPSIAMVIHYGPGSLVTRHRPALAMSRLVQARQVPLAVVTNGEDADILDGESGKIIAAGLEGIPRREQLATVAGGRQWPAIPARRREMEARILMAYEIDGRCPCDDSICEMVK
jgi:hypothetical protein